MHAEVRFRMGRRALFAGSIAFGQVGPYECLAGRVLFVIDPDTPAVKTAKERSARGDPRPALQERYRSRVSYVRATAVAALRLVEQRLLLEEDADR